MLKTILIDDEENSLKSLSWELTQFCNNVSILKTFTKASEGILYLKNNSVDCVFLDIEMPEMDGFKFLEYFPERNFQVVFVTAYHQYAIKAIKQQAIDYLLKPVDADDLIITVEKIKKRLKDQASWQRIEERLFALPEKRITIPVDGKLVFLSASDILYCESDGNYCKIFTEDQKHIFVTKKLKEIHQLLPGELFFRVHKSYVVNLQKIKEYLKTDGYLVVGNHKKIPVSRTKKATFLDSL
ncbi:LytR/AlgR family response regulator transcription factor [Aequorivita echinoideorum]|uniref:LytTR family DNA-binding domain-containing protein n=1 Tax=Aequorivita echinoideorum TaxID=1549647 RepID=A0ABS5S0G9_9FLAO|nr:LytTR family DNA-binding domain-containing protein [Aequorivita echinoideorum]MBT0606706.1 LytTR family DNA-binding domain-containing protein [Aequorivita echinoideorum]